MEMKIEELRKERKSKNLCVQCGAKLDREGIYCIRCNTNNNGTKYKKVKELREKGLCSTCRKPLDRETGWFCTVCASKLKHRARERSAFRRENGLCVQCGTVTDLGSYCQRCRDMRMDRYRSKKSKEYING